jgi:hypothetical protein
MLSREMICSLICKQMGKRDDSYGVTVLAGPERRRRRTTAEKLVWRPRPVLARLRADITSTLICSPFGGGRHALEPLGRCPAPRQDDEIHFAAVSVAPVQHALAAPSGTCRPIEIEFAAGVRVRITGAADATTLTAAVAALTNGRPP